MLQGSVETDCRDFINADNVHELRLMIQNGLPVDTMVEEDGDTLLFFAVQRFRNNNFNMINMLLEMGANVTLIHHGWSILHMQCVVNGSPVLTAFLLRQPKIDKIINLRTPFHGFSALHFASSSRQFENVRALVEAGANFQLLDKNGYTPANVVPNVSPEIRHYLTATVPGRIGACTRAIFALIICRRHAIGTFGMVDKHNVLQICRILWDSRRLDVWD